MLINVLKTCTSRKIKEKDQEKTEGKYLEEAVRHRKWKRNKKMKAE
jgi:hypothetical protein